MEPLRVRVGDNDVVLSTPAEARAAGRKWSNMARELGPEVENEAADVTAKRRELRARAKAAQDWARRAEDSAPSAPKTEPAPAAKPPAGAEEPSRSRRQAAKALAATGVKKGARAASSGRKTARKAVRRYERSGGVFETSSIGELAVFFLGSLVALTLIEDMLSQKGSTGFVKATDVATTLAHRVIAPVPLVAGITVGPTTEAPASSSSSSSSSPPPLPHGAAVKS